MFSLFTKMHLLSIAIVYFKSTYQVKMNTQIYKIKTQNGLKKIDEALYIPTLYDIIF